MKAGHQKSEYEKFDRMMRKLLSVPHSRIKAKLDAEKAAKKRKKDKKSQREKQS